MLLVLFEVIFSLFVVKEGNLLVIILTSLAISAFFSLVLSFFSKKIQNKLNYIFMNVYNISQKMNEYLMQQPQPTMEEQPNA